MFYSIVSLRKIQQFFAILAALTLIFAPLSQALALSNPGSVWTTTGSCGTPQNVNSYEVGQHVYINGSNFAANTQFSWSIKPAAGGVNAIAIASGQITSNGSGAFCFDAITLTQPNIGGPYKVDVNGKNDNFSVVAGTPTPVLCLDDAATNYHQEGTCTYVCPQGFSGEYPNCVAPTPVCQEGYTGTYPNCVAPVVRCENETANNYQEVGVCTFNSDDSEEDVPPVINTCLLPSTLGDDNTFIMSSSGEKTLSDMLADHGYAAINTVDDEHNYQVWNLADNTANSITFSMRVLGKRAGNTEVLGYYKAGNTLTFTPVLTQVDNTDGEATVSVTIPAAFANSFGFALESADKTWYSEVALNSDAKDHVAAYNPSTNKYLLAFEDFNNLGDGDFNDIVIEVVGVTCDHTTGGGNGDDPMYKLYGNVWHDIDKDDVIDETEPNLSDWTVRAIDANDSEKVFIKTTDANGHYEFDVPAGTWIISELTNDGWVLLSPGDGAHGTGTYTVTVPAPEVLTFMNWLIPTAEAAALVPTFGPYNFGNILSTTTSSSRHHHGGGSSNGNNASTGQVLGDSITNKAPVGEVLGASTTTMPVGAPNTGAGGTAATPTSASSFAVILTSRTTVRKVK